MNGHDFTLEQNTEARMMLAVARRGLAAAINDAENGIGHLSCDDPQTMNHIRAYWKRIHERYLETDSLIADLVACARNITDGGEWNPSELATDSKTTGRRNKNPLGFSRGEEVNCLNRGSSDRPNLATAATGNGRWNGTAGTACSSSAG